MPSASTDPASIFFYYTFHFRPNIFAAWLHMSLFLAVTIVVFVQALLWRSPRYQWILVGVGAFEAAGYGLRVMAVQQTSLIAFIQVTLFLLLAPIFLILTNYKTVARLLAASNQSIHLTKRFALKPVHIARIFLGCDIITFFIQAGGGGLMAMKNDSLVTFGQNLARIGLAIQLVFFLGFMAITRHVCTGKRFGVVSTPALTPVVHCLAVTTSFIFVRNIYRMAEFSLGIESPLVTHEIAFSAMETMMIFFSFLAYIFWPLGKLFPDKEDALWKQQLDAVLRGENPVPASECQKAAPDLAVKEIELVEPVQIALVE